MAAARAGRLGGRLGGRLRLRGSLPTAPRRARRRPRRGRANGHGGGHLRHREIGRRQPPPHLVTATSREDWHRARQYGRTASGLLGYEFWKDSRTHSPRHAAAPFGYAAAASPTATSLRRAPEGIAVIAAMQDYADAGRPQTWKGG